MRARPVMLMAAAAVMAAMAPLLAPASALSLLMIYGLLALSLGLVWGFGGVQCLGMSAFYGLGAYAYAIAAGNGLNPWLALALAAAAGGASAMAVGALLFYRRLDGVVVAVMTLVVTLALHRAVAATSGPSWRIGSVRLGGYNGIPGFEPLHVPWDSSLPLMDGGLYALCAGCLAACLLLSWWIRRGAFGRVIAGMRENPLAMSLLGYDMCWRRTVLLGAGGAMAGLAGGLFATWAEIVTPSLFSLGQAAEIIIWMIAGGAASLWGPVAGAVGLGGVKMLLGQQALVDNSLVMGVILLAAIFLRRGWRRAR